PSRYSNKAMIRLKENNYEVFAFGNRHGKVMGIEISTEFPNMQIDTLTLYLSSKNQKQYYNNIINSNPKRIIFNPGAENEELSIIARVKGIEVINACTLVMLSIGNF
ncbi:MAG: CoA-binding protein, partial [Candidatus Actinomarinaceae bacterium]